MDHSHMDHGSMHHGSGGMDMGGGGDSCNMNMLFTWDTTNLCIIFRQWHIRGPFSLLISLLAVVAITAGYEALRAFARRYEARHARNPDALPSRRNSNNGGSNNNNNNLLSSMGGGGGGEGVDQQQQRVRMTKSVLYGAQNFYAFMIMLLFMTYNGWVMVSVAVGAAVGYHFFGEGGKGYKETACH